MNWKKMAALLLCLLLAAPLAGCSLLERLGIGGDASQSAAEDDGGEEHGDEYPVQAGGVQLSSRPGRVVSLAPSITEKLYDLGLHERLVGVSDFCDYPASAAELTPCGTAQIPDVELIEALRPGVVVTEAPLPESAREQLERYEIPVAVFPRSDSVEALRQTYIDLARLMEGESAGRQIGGSIADQIKDRLDQLSTALAAYTEINGRKTVLYLRLLEFTVATGDTFEQELLDAACMTNLAERYTGWLYPEENARTADGQADFSGVDVLFMDRDFVSIEALEENEFYRGLPAVIQDRYQYISSVAMERQGLRTIDQLAAMAAYVYPDAPLTGGYTALVDPEAADIGEPGEADEDDEPTEMDG